MHLLLAIRFKLNFIKKLKHNARKLDGIAFIWVQLLRNCAQVNSTCVGNPTWEKLKLAFCIYFSNICSPFYITYKSSQFFDFVFFFLDVLVRFSSQCELTNNWSSNNKQCLDIL